MTSRPTRSRRRALSDAELTLSSDSVLMQDYLHTSGILLSRDAARAIAAFQNVDGDDEAIVIDSDGRLAHVHREPVSDSGWNMYGLGARFQAIAAVDSTTAWAVGTVSDATTPSTSLWRCTRGSWVEVPATLPGGEQFSDISAGTDGTIWALDTKGSLYVMGTTAKPTWTPIDVPALTQPPSGTADSWWAVAAADDGSGALIQWENGAWSTASPPGTTTSVTVGGDGTVWSLGTAGTTASVLGWFDLKTNVQLPGTVPSWSPPASLACSDATDLWLLGDALYHYDDDTWLKVPAPPVSVSGDVGSTPAQLSVAPDGSVWLLDPNGTVWQQGRPRPWRWFAAPTPPGPAHLSTLTAAAGDSAWAVDQAGTIWSFGGIWSQLTAALPNGVAPRQVAAGSAGTLWAIDSGGYAYEYSAAGDDPQWQAVPSTVLPPLTTAPTAWAVGTNGTIWQYESGGWVQFFHELPGAVAPRQVAAGVDGSLWAVGDDGGLYEYATDQNAWQAVVGAPAGVTQVAAVDIDNIWTIAPDATAGTGSAVYLRLDGAWMLVANAAVTTPFASDPLLSADPDGNVWLLDGYGIPRAFRWNESPSSWEASTAAVPLESIAATSTGAAWAVGNGGFWRYAGGTWRNADLPLPGWAAADQVSIGHDGTLWALDDIGRLYTRAATPTLASAAVDLDVPTAVHCDATGIPHLFYAGTDGAAWMANQEDPEAWWNGFASLGGPGASSLQWLAAGLDQNRCLQLFAVAAGSLWRIGQTTPGGGWGQWSALGAPAGVSLERAEVGANQDGSAVVFAFAPGGSVHALSETAAGGWEWDTNAPPPDVRALRVAVGLNAGGCIEIVALGADGSAYYLPQASPNGGWASAWTSWGRSPDGKPFVSLTLGTNADGRLQLFAVSTEWLLFTKWETGPGVWSDWSTLAPPPGPQVTAVAVGLDPTGRMQVVAIGLDRTVQTISQQHPNGQWGSWSPVLGSPAPGDVIGFPLIAPTASGPLAAFVLSAGTTPRLWTTTQWFTGETPVWSPWAPLDQAGPIAWTPVAGAPALTQAPSGTATGLWAIDASGDPVNFTGGAWDTVALPGAAAAGSVDVGADGSVWAASAPGAQGAGTSYRYEGGSWQALANADLAQAPTGIATALWGVSPSGTVRRSSDGGETWMDDPGFVGVAARLAVGSDGSVWVLDADGAAWTSAAWQRLMVPTGMPGADVSCTAVAAATDENGVPYAVFLDTSTTFAYTSEVSPGLWSYPQPFPCEGGTIGLVTEFGVTWQQDTGQLIAYAVSSDDQRPLAVAVKAPGSTAFSPAQVCTMTVGGEPLTGTPPALVLAAVDADHWYWFAVDPAEGRLLAATASAQNPSPNFSPVVDAGSETPPTGFERLLPPRWPQAVGAPCTLALDGEMNVHVVSLTSTAVENGSYTGGFLALTGAGTQIPGGVSSIATTLQAMAGAPPTPRVYVTAPTYEGGPPAVWQRCLTDRTVPVSDAAAWNIPWLPFAKGYFRVTNGPAQPASTLFGLGAGSFDLLGLTEDPVTGKWTDLPITRPSQSGADTEQVAMYETVIKVSSSDGKTPPGLPITISTATPVLMWVNGTAYAVDATRSVTCPTDAAGKLRTQTLATGLSTPSLTVRIAGEGGTRPGAPDGDAETIAPDRQVYDFLAGKAPLAVGGGPPTDFTVQNLETAAIGGQPLWPSLTTAAAELVVSVASEIAAVQAGTATIAGFSVDLSDRANPRLTTFADAAELAAHRQAARERTVEGFGASWDDIADADPTGVSGAVLGGVESGVAAATEFTVDAYNKTLDFVVDVGGRFVSLVDIAIETVAEAARAIQAVVEAVIGAIQLFIEWLLALFEWKDIWATKQKIEGYLAGACKALQGQVATAQDKISDVFDQLQQGVDAAIDEVAERITSNTRGWNSFGSLPTNLLPTASRDQVVTTGSTAGTVGAPAAGGIAGGLSIPGVSMTQVNWLLDKVVGSLTPSFSLGPGVDPTDLFEAIDLHGVVDRAQDAVNDFIGFVSGVFTDPAQFATLTIEGLLRVAKDFAGALLEALEAVALALVKFAAQALAALDGALDQSIYIPGVSQLYEFITWTIGESEDLTVLHLFSLMAAVPLTIGYKALYGGAPFSESAAAPDSSAPGTTDEEWRRLFLINGYLCALPSAILRDGWVAGAPPGVDGFDPMGRFLSAFFDFHFIMQQIYSWPGGMPHFGITNAADFWQFTNWGSYWIAVLSDLILLATPAGPSMRLTIGFCCGGVALFTACMWIVCMLADGEFTYETLCGSVFAICKSVPLLSNTLVFPKERELQWETTDGLVDTARTKFFVDGLMLTILPVTHYYS